MSDADVDTPLAAPAFLSRIFDFGTVITSGGGSITTGMGGPSSSIFQSHGPSTNSMMISTNSMIIPPDNGNNKGDDYDTGISEQMVHLIFSCLMIVFGIIFAFLGQKLEKTVFFLCGFFAGVAGSLYGLQFIEERMLINGTTFPKLAEYIICMACGLLAGYITKSLIKLAMLCLGTCVGLLAASWGWQILDTWDWWHYHVSEHVHGSIPLVLQVCCGLCLGLLLQTKKGTDLMFIVVTSVLGSYVFTVGGNELHKSFDGTLYCPLWTPGAMIEHRAQLLKLADSHFWILFAVWVFLGVSGAITQWRHREEKQKRHQRRRSSLMRNREDGTPNGNCVDYGGEHHHIHVRHSGGPVNYAQPNRSSRNYGDGDDGVCYDDAGYAGGAGGPYQVQYPAAQQMYPMQPIVQQPVQLVQQPIHVVNPTMMQM